MANSKAERRRFDLARRQLTFAEIARREAMAALADAVNEEERTASLAERSRELLRDYEARADTEYGGSLRDHNRFTQRLQSIAEQADQARNDANDQAQWQVQSLAVAETRARRFDERMQSASREIEAIKEKRAQAQEAALARKLHRPDTTAE